MTFVAASVEIRNLFSLNKFGVWVTRRQLILLCFTDKPVAMSLPKNIDCEAWEGGIAPRTRRPTVDHGHPGTTEGRNNGGVALQEAGQRGGRATLHEATAEAESLKS